MGARQQLNQAHATGEVILAGWLGAVFQSWWVFAVLLALSVMGGSIRPAGGRR